MPVSRKRKNEKRAAAGLPPLGGERGRKQGSGSTRSASAAGQGRKVVSSPLSGQQLVMLARREGRFAAGAPDTFPPAVREPLEALEAWWRAVPSVSKVVQHLASEPAVAFAHDEPPVLMLNTLRSGTDPRGLAQIVADAYLFGDAADSEVVRSAGLVELFDLDTFGALREQLQSALDDYAEVPSTAESMRLFTACFTTPNTPAEAEWAGVIATGLLDELAGGGVERAIEQWLMDNYRHAADLSLLGKQSVVAEADLGVSIDGSLFCRLLDRLMLSRAWSAIVPASDAVLVGIPDGAVSCGLDDVSGTTVREAR